MIVQILSSIGLLNGLLLAFFFLFGFRPLKKHHTFFGLFLIAMTVRIAKPLVFNLALNTSMINGYFLIALITSSLIGPFLYLYIHHYIDKDSSKSNWIGHLTINVLWMSSLLILYPYWNHREIWSDYLIYGIYLQRVIYLIASAYLVHQFCGLFVFKSSKLKRTSIWLHIILLGKIIIFLSYIITFSGYGSIVQVFFIFCFFIYLLFFLLMQSSKSRNEIIYKPSLKYGGRAITQNASSSVIEKLNLLLTSHEIFTSPDLKLKDVALQLNVTPHDLSQIINQKLNKNFKQLINEHRVEKAKELIVRNHQYTLEYIGTESGFKSKSNFFTTFKKMTGTTPKIFKNTFDQSPKVSTTL